MSLVAGLLVVILVVGMSQEGSEASFGLSSSFFEETIFCTSF
jgi:hypothetical protein